MNAWEKSGLTPEERALAVMHAPVYGPQTLHDHITAAIRAAVKDETERCARVAEGVDSWVARRIRADAPLLVKESA